MRRLPCVGHKNHWFIKLNEDIQFRYVKTRFGSVFLFVLDTIQDLYTLNYYIIE